MLEDISIQRNRGLISSIQSIKLMYVTLIPVFFCSAWPKLSTSAQDCGPKPNTTQTLQGSRHHKRLRFNMQVNQTKITIAPLMLTLTPSPRIFLTKTLSLEFFHKTSFWGFNPIPLFQNPSLFLQTKFEDLKFGKPR